ncbi:calpain-11 [Dromiciops gliroides]|uniref:calpain-11 n=1 Tax=Dromiciops gliroides TaxID=33562 RepID=UPI001CC630EA|nr:calpain-11 [Dromiciops gliroides]
MAARLQRDKLRSEGLGKYDNAIPYLDQNYEEIKAKCLQNGELFTDPQFPAGPEVLGYNELGPYSQQTQGIEWKRPQDIVSDPQFILDGATRTDVCQGALGDCWLLAAIASLSLQETLLSRVILQGQSFQNDYAGIFHFRIWRFGEWLDVVVDDLLPTINNNLVFVHSAEKNEFWTALLEKAYAKLNGSYEALIGGTSTEGFEDFTGGVAEAYNLQNPPNNLLSIIQKALQRGSLIGCSITVRNNQIEAVSSLKLVKGHAYSVTALQEVNYQGKSENLIRIRNPWGQVEWTGPWSDDSSEWQEVDQQVREQLLVKMEDGEFWMSFTDFLGHFSNLEICNLTPDALSQDNLSQWHSEVYEGSWRKGSTAGGCSNYPSTFWANPQFKIQLLEPDDHHHNDNACSCLIALMQKNRRAQRCKGGDMHSIGFSIYEVPKEGVSNEPLQKNFFMMNQSLAHSGSFINRREVCAHFQLPLGEYIIVPSTFEPNQDADFIIRVFTEKQSKFQQVDNNLCESVPPLETVKESDVEDSLKEIFEQVGGKDKEIDIHGLGKILNKMISKNKDLKTGDFCMESCQNMMNLMDTDGSGHLNMMEFQVLWNKIQKWLAIFRMHDADKCGTMNSHEMRLAVEAAGIKLNNKLLEVLVSRYSDENMGISLNRFICCLVKLEAMCHFFTKMDPKKTGQAVIDLPQWLLLTMCG